MSLAMKKTYRNFLLSLGVVSVLCGAHNVSAQNAGSASLQVTKTETAYQLRVPVSRLILNLPATGLAQQDSKPEERYFHFVDQARGLVISGWFEPAHLFKGLDQFWTSETANWKKIGMPTPLNVEQTKVGDWQVIMYDMTLPKVNNTHLRAHLVKAGTWIDVHTSITGTGEISTYRQAMLELLKTIEVQEQAKD